MIGYARLTMALAVGLAALGCSFAPLSAGGKSPLSPFKPGLQTSALEVVFVRHAYELPALNEELWRQVDETSIAPDVRQALEQNGLRAGVIAGALPLALETAMSADEPSTGQVGEEAAAIQTLSQLESEPFVRRRMLHTLPGQRAELLASGLYERLPLLVRDGREAQGNSYLKAQCVIATKAVPLGDQRIRLLLVPEVQHGEPRQEIRGDDGVFRFDSARPKVACEKMAIEVVLSPGQAVVLGARTELPGSIGHYFFTEPRAGQLEQKLMLIRFTGTKFDNLLISDGAAPESDNRLAQ
jgi:hypothetical protein